MNPVRAIVFDAFGTLIRYTTRPAPYECLLRSDEQPVDRQACLTRDVPMATLAIESGVGDRLDVMEADLAEELTGLRLFPEVPDTLAKARAAGLRVAVCSNLAHAYGPAVRSLVPGLDAYVLSYEVGVTKPHQTMYRLACAELRCAPADALFVGDSKRCDFEGPKAFGMQARWLDRRGGQSLHDVLAGVI
ncbi:HAD family hydrolase [Verminephrobacter eiseniae]|uniref:HAD family hydrolase n=1 Tax=Verminephrobacter eiseniae TaxID=364317 RepID=UPI0022379FCF|nr:HAD family hydrolase [Verminephrobacter eiseniae]MCW5231672.1 HAD family hydrolase [Verminephrobacter eiseniae]MCW5293403.1 HAD family hydrolase [Verminephrobacter eiseniae]MCW8187502.1 HAD family hydrolase [Verminephrobacter eiseniae]MCW8225836.1 HAD family hydrolase [Verminephrobacter eiseniae]MCW8236734.1 HAD family hydrolase [Verminephrobacter eiseniae]